MARCFIQEVADAVATVALAKEEDWEYELPASEKPVATIIIGLDGTCMVMCEDGWREAMVGTLGLYDKDGERLHTISTAATPESGKLTFLDRLNREIDRVKAAYRTRGTWGWPTGPRGIGASWSGTPRPR